jgi:hypothetical protein
MGVDLRSVYTCRGRNKNAVFIRPTKVMAFANAQSKSERSEWTRLPGGCAPTITSCFSRRWQLKAGPPTHRLEMVLPSSIIPSVERALTRVEDDAVTALLPGAAYAPSLRMWAGGDLRCRAQQAALAQTQHADEPYFVRDKLARSLGPASERASERGSERVSERIAGPSALECALECAHACAHTCAGERLRARGLGERTPANGAVD